MSKVICEQILQAINNRNYSLALDILEMNPQLDVNTSLANGAMLISAAIANEHTQLAKKIMSSVKFDPTITGPTKRNVLFSAIKSANLELVEFILNRYAPANPNLNWLEIEFKGKTPYEFAYDTSSDTLCEISKLEKQPEKAEVLAARRARKEQLDEIEKILRDYTVMLAIKKEDITLLRRIDKVVPLSINNNLETDETYTEYAKRQNKPKAVEYLTADRLEAAFSKLAESLAKTNLFTASLKTASDQLKADEAAARAANLNTFTDSLSKIKVPS